MARAIEVNAPARGGSTAALLGIVLPLLLAACGDRGDAALSPPVAEVSPPPPAQAAPPAPTKPRLIVLVSIDTLRADHLGFYGSKRPTSPVLDALAAEGVVFEDASATASWTLPSHASMLTGLYPNEHGATSDRQGLAPQVPTLASLLARRGYRTAAVVNSLYLKQGNFGLTRDFEDYVYVPEALDRRGPSTWVTDQAIDWIKKYAGRRLFVFMHYYDVHADYASLPEYEKLFVSPYDGPARGTAHELILSTLDEEFVNRCKRDFENSVCTSWGVKRDELKRISYKERDLRHLRELYDAGIRQLDTELGRLFDFLRAQDLMGETLLVVTSDHGEEFLEHGRLGHGWSAYQELLHVPLLIRGPGIPAGVRIRAPVSLVDITPTILRQAGAEPEPSMAGLDLAALWRGEEPASFSQRVLRAEAPAYTAFVKEMVLEDMIFFCSIRQGRYKLLYVPGGDKIELYDLATDPREKIDRSNGEPEVTARLRAATKALSPSVPGFEAQLDESENQRLRALGYLR